MKQLINFFRLTEDILDYDPSIEPTNLVIGSTIRIKWTDGTIYSCKYLGRKRVLLYHIKSDNEIRQLRRSEFTYDVQPSLIPGQTQNEHNYSRRQPMTTRRKRSNRRRQRQKIKRKRRCTVLSPSLISLSSDKS